jgi:hypothetical protein
LSSGNFCGKVHVIQNFFFRNLIFSVLSHHCSAIISACVLLSACATTEEIIRKDTGTVDLGALEKFGKLVEKYDFAPHRAVVMMTSGYAHIERTADKGINGSFWNSCKRAGGEPCCRGDYVKCNNKRDYNYCKHSLYVDGDFSSEWYGKSVFGEMFMAKHLRNGFIMVGNERVDDLWYRCVLPNEIIEMTYIMTKTSQRFVVIQNNDDIEASKSLTDEFRAEAAQAERSKKDEKKRLLQSAIDDWQYASVMLQKSLKPGNTVYFVMEFPRMSVWFERAGMVVEVKPPLAFVQIQDDRRWVRIEEIHAKVPTILFCHEPIGTGSFDATSDRFRGRCFQK